jgi:hypothetical protein
MYDEIGVEGSVNGVAEPVFTHAILLSDGREIRLRFNRFTFSQPERGLPAPTPLSVEGFSALSNSA